MKGKETHFRRWMRMARISDKEKFIKLVPEDGSTVGNFSLKKDLGWDDEKYWNIRDELISDGMISVGRGKGGSVYRLAVPVIEKEVTDKYKREDSLYEPFLKVISTFFIKDKKIKNYICQKTANQGKKKTGGKWTRPDISIVSVDTYSFLPGKFLDIISFELKMWADFNVAGVFETAAHSKYATKSYYVAYLPGEWDPENMEHVRIKSECERFGVGLMYFTDPEKYETYEILVEPERRMPDPADMDQFINIQIDDANKRKLSEYLH